MGVDEMHQEKKESVLIPTYQHTIKSEHMHMRIGKHHLVSPYIMGILLFEISILDGEVFMLNL